MGNTITTAGLTRDLAARHRVVMLGGLAVISHGHARPTFDADIWLDPNLSPSAWTEATWSLTAHNLGLRFVSIGSWLEISRNQLADVILRDGVVRMMGANQPLERFLTAKVAESALSHPSNTIRELGMRFLHELADEGNPFAAEILRKLG